MDGTLYTNIGMLADNIVRDMTFLGVLYSSTLEVGTGKSTFAQQLGEAYTEMVNKKHNLNLEFNMKNVVFKPADLIERSFQLPKYSCIILDEWEDAHYFSELALALRQFFRKCRQLNLFMIIIIPNFFQLPISYAISRSVFAIDVKFGPDFHRGHFNFYNFNRKKDLYVKGKKTYNYFAAPSDFHGVFTPGYAVDDEEYRRAKYLDMMKAEKAEKTKPTERQIKVQLYKQLYQNLDGVTSKKLAEAFGISDRTATRYLNDDIEEVSKEISSAEVLRTQSFKVPKINNLTPPPVEGPDYIPKEISPEGSIN